MWVVAAFNVGIFMFFLLSFLKPGGSDEWRSMGIAAGQKHLQMKQVVDDYGIDIELFE
jgi:hypothetical protein